MRKKRAESWVVYHTSVRGVPAGANAVCPQDEWDAIAAAGPGTRTLIRAGIDNEGEAERLARGTSGDPTPRRPRVPSEYGGARPSLLPAATASA